MSKRDRIFFKKKICPEDEAGLAFQENGSLLGPELLHPESIEIQDSAYGPMDGCRCYEWHYIKFQVHGEIGKEKPAIFRAGTHRLRVGCFLGEGSAQASPRPHTQFTLLKQTMPRLQGQRRKGAGR